MRGGPPTQSGFVNFGVVNCEETSAARVGSITCDSSQHDKSRSVFTEVAVRTASCTFRLQIPQRNKVLHYYADNKGQPPLRSFSKCIRASFPRRVQAVSSCPSAHHEGAPPLPAPQSWGGWKGGRVGLIYDLIWYRGFLTLTAEHSVSQ